MRTSYILKTVCIFVGAVVGAGFATGREIIVFFGDLGILSPVLAGVLMGAFAGLFIAAGKTVARLGKDGSIAATAARGGFCCVNVVGVAATVLIFATMTAGLEQLLARLTGVEHLGVAAALAAVALAGKDLRGVGAVNLILVPALAAMILYLAAKSEQTGESLPVAIYPSVSYCAMNMLLGGVLVSKDAEEASAAEICCISAASGCVMAALLAGVYVVSMGYADFAMPLFEFCRGIGAGFVGAAIAITAILTTLVGAAKTLRDGFAKMLGSGVSASCAVAMLALASSKLDFASAVDGFYPLIGAAASAVVIGIIPVFVASMLSVRRLSIHSVNLFRRRR